MLTPKKSVAPNLAEMEFDDILQTETVQALFLLGVKVPAIAINYVYRELYGISASATRDFDFLIKEGILIPSGNAPAYMQSNTWHIINPEYWFDIIKGLNLSTLDTMIKRMKKLLRTCPFLGYDPKYNWDADYLKAVCLYLNGSEEYEEEAAKLTPKFEKLTQELHNRIVANGDFVPFVKAFNNDMLLNAMQLMRGHTAYMLGNKDSRMLEALFFNDFGQPTQSDSTALLYLMHRMMYSGRLPEYRSKIINSDDSLAKQILNIIDYLYANKPEDVVSHFAQIVLSGRSSILQIPLFLLLFASAMFLAPREKVESSVKGIYRMLSQKLEYRDVTMLIMQFLYNDVRKEQWSHITGEEPTKAIVALMIRHFRFFKLERDEPDLVKEAEEYVEGSDFNFLKLLYATDFKSLMPQRETLEFITGMKSFLPKIDRAEEWELIIDDILDSINRHDNPANKQERIIFCVNPRHLRVEARLQKRTKKGDGWTSGSIIKDKLLYTPPECATDQDRLVAQVLFGESGYSQNTAKVLLALAGHPLVFTDDSRRLKMDIVKVEPHIETSTDKKGFTEIRSNMPSEFINGRYYLQKVSPTLIKVGELTLFQKRTIESIDFIPKMPPAANEKLSVLLEKIADKMLVMSDKLKDSENFLFLDPDSTIILQLIPEDEIITAKAVVRPLKGSLTTFKPGEDSEYCGATIDGKYQQTHRDFDLEKSNLKKLRSLLQDFKSYKTKDGWDFSLSAALEVLQILQENTEVCQVEWPKSGKLKLMDGKLDFKNASLSVHKANDWFELDGEVSISENTKIKIGKLLELMKEQDAGMRFIKVGDNEFIAISEQLRKRLEQLGRMGDMSDKNGMQLSPFAANLLREMEEEGMQIEADKAFNKLIENIRNSANTQPRIPKVNATLREYQKDGVRWMMRLAAWGAGACLADDMGLGKTLQTITVMLARSKKGPQLVVMPASVLLNWQSEIERFAPALRIRNLNKPGENREELITEAKAGDIVITTYGLLASETELLSEKQWTTIVLDEAHTIKNRDTKMSKAAMQLNGDFKVILTGTPIQNHLGEIWNLFHFILPGLLGSLDSFSERYAIPIQKNGDKEQQQVLKQMIAPFILRRTKNEVLNDLPEKTEITMSIELSEEETALYEEMRQSAIKAMAEAENGAIEALAWLTKLRLTACNPRLCDSILNLESSKMNALMHLVDNLILNGHRSLVFSQFTKHLDLVKEKLDEKGISYLYLDGSTPVKERNRLVKLFQSANNIPIFLISLKAGGLGLNLTAADYVIHMDPWWNPAIEDQASDRSYRIGQERPVTVYRLIARNTIEEKILALHNSKKSLADALLEGTDMAAGLSQQELLELLTK